jgi:hypothetical protein
MEGQVKHFSKRIFSLHLVDKAEIRIYEAGIFEYEAGIFTNKASFFEYEVRRFVSHADASYLLIAFGNFCLLRYGRSRSRISAAHAPPPVTRWRGNSKKMRGVP